MVVPSGRPLALAAFSGVLLTVSFPMPHLSTVAWIALVPLFAAVSHASLRGAFVLGWVTGLTFFTGTLHWVTTVMVEYGHLPPWLSYLLLALLAASLALYVGLFGLGVRALAACSTRLQLLAAPALWTTVEYARAHLLTGFPWASLGYSQATTLPVIQIADLGGVYAVSFVIVFVNAALAKALDAFRPVGEMPIPLPVASFAPMGGPNPLLRRAVLGPLAAVILVLNAVLIYGHWRLDGLQHDPPGTTPLTVAVVQGNIDQHRKWDPPFLRETIARYQTLTRELAPGRPDLIVWPESAMPFWFEREAAERDDLLRFVREKRVAVLFGSPAFDVERDRVARAYNSAYLVSADGAVLGRYDKRHLVPFGEYVPLSPLLFFVDKLVEGIADFSPGTGPTVFPVGTARLGALICYEVIFPELTRRAAAAGATVMATITNDAWYGRSAAPYQHFDMVVFRAVENRIPFARAANTGISGFIDAGGRVLSASDLFVPAARAAALAPRTRTTFYTRYGDVFAWLCVGATAALLAREIRRARGGSNATHRATMPSHRLDRKETRP